MMLRSAAAGLKPMTQARLDWLRIVLLALGVLERDGLWIGLGHVCTLIDLALLVSFGATVVVMLERIWHWLA